MSAGRKSAAETTFKETDVMTPDYKKIRLFQNEVEQLNIQFYGSTKEKEHYQQDFLEKEHGLIK